MSACSSGNCEEGRFCRAKSIGWIGYAIGVSSCACTSGNEVASEIRNAPERARISEVTYAPHSRAFPMSKARDLIYTPEPQVTESVRSGYEYSRMSIEEIWTGLGGRVTSTPERAKSYKRLPSCFNALYIGGVWCMLPMNMGNVCSMSDRVMVLLGATAVMVPSAS